jgi:hypothetical protein
MLVNVAVAEGLLDLQNTPPGPARKRTVAAISVSLPGRPAGFFIPDLITLLLSSSEDPVVICKHLVSQHRHRSVITYLTREYTRRNGVDANLSARKSSSQHATQMRRRRLRTRIRKLSIAAALHVSRNTAHVDHRRRVARSNVFTLCEQRQEGHAHVENGGHVGLEGVGPALRL